ncbi:MAG: DUF1850 domain-containing protein [Rhodocyclaceae bacterium]|nr:DUF1850 domain-containing protein [Rhodocyclaceae bacterium]
MALCLLSGAMVVALATESFTLAFTHSVEKIRWEEDWRLEKQKLILVEARIRGTGAGMEAPATASFANGVWRYSPGLAPIDHINLLQTQASEPFALCVGAVCRPLSAWVGATPDQPVRLEPCRQSSAKSPPFDGH